MEAVLIQLGASVNTEAGLEFIPIQELDLTQRLLMDFKARMDYSKNRNGTTGSTENWTVYHVENTDNPETDYLSLNSSGSTSDLNTIWNDTAPTSTLISIGLMQE